MFCLTREVRFAVNAGYPPGADPPVTNSYAGFPTLTGLGHYFTLQVTLAGELHSESQYLRNIKDIDREVRGIGIPVVGAWVRDAGRSGVPQMLTRLWNVLQDRWPGTRLDALRLQLSPFLAYHLLDRERPMVRLSQKFEFSASHRLHNPALSDEQNRATFGKCNNPAGHGHNYELQVTLAGEPNVNGLLVDVPRFEQIVAETVVNRFDHKNLNTQVPEFRDLIPSVENIARVIHGLLEPPFAAEGARLASVTVWETPKTWCEYAE